LKVACSNLTVGKPFYLQNTYLIGIYVS
jgi:hypothetical protein